MRQQKIEGIILRTQPFFEKDKKVEIFSPTHGKCVFLAKGTSSSKSRFGGRLEVSNHVVFSIYKGKSFGVVTDCDLKKSYLNIREDFNLIALMCYFFDIIRKSTVYDQHNEPFFKLLAETLDLIEANNKDSDEKSYEKIKSFFYRRYLQIEGLLKENKGFISDYEFQIKFEEYSSNKLVQPVLI
jgi:DNA repair protein RecO